MEITVLGQTTAALFSQVTRAPRNAVLFLFFFITLEPRVE